MQEIPLFKPSVPKKESYFPLIEEMDAVEMYSNFGPLYHKLKAGFSAHLGLSSKNVELVSSGTAGLIASLAILKKADKPYCLLPSWTFVATAQAVIAAGLTPVFVDVDIKTMALTEKELSQVTEATLSKTSVILVVSPFGLPLDLDLTLHFARNHAIEVLVDAAAGFEGLSDVDAHTVISLHATKTLGIGEGGLVVSPSVGFIERVHGYSNFGFLGSRSAEAFGINLKLPEIACAIGLASLASWSEIRASYYKTASKYLARLHGIVQFQPGWGESWVSSVCVVQFENSSLKSRAMALLQENQIMSRNWWNSGCHLEPAFAGSKQVGDLRNTQTLFETTLGIPFHLELSDTDIDRITNVLNRV